MTDNIDKGVSINVTIDGVILYGNMEFNADGTTDINVYPITHCRWVGDENTPYPSPLCETGACPFQCPFNDYTKEKRILDENKDKMVQLLKTVAKTIYG